MLYALLFSILLMQATDARAKLVLNEILYDPEGSDSGREFVELYCVGPEDAELTGVSLVFVNGADPGQPKTLWLAPAGLRLAAGVFLVLGEDEVPERDIQLSLGLQNGPDALWLMRDEEFLDQVAWGEVEGLGEGTPAVDPSSRSLGRVPDGADLDDNFLDWQALVQPSPGAPNARAMRVRPVELRVDPPWRREPGPIDLSLALLAEGYAELQTAHVDWFLDGQLQHAEAFQLARAESLWTVLELFVDRGDHVLRTEVSVGDELLELDAVYRVGAGTLHLNEVMAKPLSENPEWIEVRYHGAARDTLFGCAIADASRQWRELPPLHFSPDGFAILSSDASAFRASHAAPTSLPVLEPAGTWPTLNNSNLSGRDFADEVLLRGADGAVLDHLVYSGDELPVAGRSLERGRVVSGRARDWFASPGAPTPGMENLSAAYAPPEEGLSARPDPFTPDGDGIDDLLHVQLRAGPFGGQMQASVRDLAGEQVVELGVERADAELQQWIWDGRDQSGRSVPMGAYVVVVTGGGSGIPPRSWRALIALGRQP